MLQMKRRLLYRWVLSLAICSVVIGGWGGISTPAAALPKLPASYKSVDELYAALAKFPEAQRQEAILKGAQKEGIVNVYEASNEDQIGALIKDFSQRYPGVKVDLFRSLADEVAQKMLTEVRADRWFWDLGNVGPGYLDLKKEKALAMHYGLVARGSYPKYALGADWFGVETLPLIIAYNTNLVKANEAPKSYKDLLDPKWKGKASIDAAPDNLIASMVKAWGKQKTDDWLNKFVNVNQALIRKGHTVQTKLLIAGEFPVASEIYAYAVENMVKTQGAPADWVIPQDLLEADIPGQIIARRAQHPYAALLWAQYRTSREGQNVYAKFGRIGVRPDADMQYPRMKQLVAGPALDHLSLLTVEDGKYFDQASELINKYIAPRLRAK